jgi:hypothetical protein
MLGIGVASVLLGAASLKQRGDKTTSRDEVSRRVAILRMKRNTSAAGSAATRRDAVLCPANCCPPPAPARPGVAANPALKALERDSADPTHVADPTR